MIVAAPMSTAEATVCAARVRESSDVLYILAAAYVVVLPFQIQLARYLRIAPADLFVLLALFLAAHQLRYRRHAWSVWHLGLLLSFACGCLLASLRFGHLDSYVLLNKSAGLVVLMMSYLVITSAASGWSRIRRMLRLFVLSVSIQNAVFAAIFVAGFLSGRVLPGSSYGGQRLSGLLYDPNAYGGLLALAFTLCEAASMGKNPLFAGRTLVICRLTLGLGLLFTFSRTAWLSLAPVLLGMLVVRFRSMILILATIVVGVGIVWLAAGDQFLGFARGMALRPETNISRMELMQGALEEASKHPVLGGGLGSFLDAEGTIVHNTPLWFLADLGLAGFVILAGFLLWFFASGLSAYELAPAAAKPVIGGLLVGHAAMSILSMGIEAFYQRHWWLVCALIGSCYSLTQTRRLGRMHFRQNI